MELFKWMELEYANAHSWITFQNRTANGICEAAKKSKCKDWHNHPLFSIQLDMLARKGIEAGELRDVTDKLS